MILHKTFGQHLRLGNLLFKYAWTIQAMKRYGCESAFPEHYLWKYLEKPPVIDNDIPVDEVFKTQKWEFDPVFVDGFCDDFKNKNVDIDLGCFFQSQRWFENCENDIKEALRFKKEHIDRIKEKYKEALSSTTIALSIRRGDFVGHGAFAQIPIDWYFKALGELTPRPIPTNVILFSDDIEWCKTIFKGDGFYFADPNNTHITKYDSENYHADPTEQLILMSLCDDFIIGNSTFSWWGAFLGSNPDKKVIHSGEVFDNDYKSLYDIKDYYHPEWIEFKG